ncbi:MAG: phosphate acetyltransferase [Candidatus Lambdaproteobacteria bacterium RIFOXYD1_FULL_56_27]|uniref:Phosphate acetyltransferase n=1 Tax=Candidatus Lambdaproteobacteria bacterium RIFOXYD2_FULL_56_26 TaxID=1817773 RepID=A0A1F6GZV4_9PROT|nr:MAG: phosphate acetyltransferase [Candidatus Lambdaproteobacteria bacterium RIFOXYC1_FULL_56_13]OGH03619.1 MAG: phosphate acetyltransferase [Candidatus Lambdaproteobacteria bacterium RIFOXYD2_FULL_56_26]OGH06550.1 MAG: phosphate acetyltransferase [Candidatus Lambdaproteobacteria bacterium RIFOXYD1_FULL_56_27]
MTANLYISATEAKSGKSMIALGLMELLVRKLERVAFFKPIVNLRPGQTDKDIKLIQEHYHLVMPFEKMYAYTAEDASRLIATGRHQELLEGILARYAELAAEADFVLCLGSDFEGVTKAFEYDFNAEIALNLSAPMLLVMKVRNKTHREVIDASKVAVESFESRGNEILGLFLNQCDNQEEGSCLEQLREQLGDKVEFVFALPDDPSLRQANVAEVAELLDAQVLFGFDQLTRQVGHYEVAGMQLRNFLPRLMENSLILTPGDRLDLILGCLASFKSSTMPHPAGIVLTEGIKPDPSLHHLIEGINDLMPILYTNKETYETAAALSRIHTALSPDNPRKIAKALGLFEAHVDLELLSQKVVNYCPRVLTPKMFEFSLIQQALKDKKHIVLPEGEDERILKAAEILHSRQVAQFTLLGDPDEIRAKIGTLGLHLEGVPILKPENAPRFEEYCLKFMELRAHKNPTLEQARDIMRDVSYFGTMMVQLGHADGMVSGAAHSTMHTIRPGFELIKTKPNCSLVSSVFFMCLADRVLVYGDCAVNPNPNATQLAEIAVSSAETALAFGIEPRVAMLSYSTGESGKGEDVDLVREAVRLAQQKSPDLLVEGPMQYDAAVDPAVGQAKMPGSKVAGKATVFIFPDLNTGNNTYKAVQRSAGAVAIGPILQGLRKPVNDLSRGCLVPDVINTIVITCIQAQAVAKG